MFKQITIIGPGLLGASLAMAVHSKKLAKKIVLWGRNKSKLQDCVRHPWCDISTTDLQEATTGADLIVICTPVNHIISTLKQLDTLNLDPVWITDVGSTKEDICQFSETLSIAEYFIGSHPMAGSDKSGHQNASKSLYENQPCIISPSTVSQESGTLLIQSFWKSLGMKTGIMQANEHDKMVASISHLPHLISSALCYNLSKSKSDNWLPFSGNGLRDTSRIAGGDPSMWCDIVEQNKAPILSKIESFQKDLEQLKNHLQSDERNEIFQFLKEGQGFRRKIEQLQ